MKCTVCDGSGRTPSPTGVPMIGATSCAGCFGTGCGPAPSTPGGGAGRPDTAQLREAATNAEVGGIVDETIITAAADWIDAQPPASPAPPTPTPCPYIVTADEGTSHCSLAESRPAPPAVPGERWSCASCGATNGACAGKISQGEGGCCSGCDHRSNRPSASGLTINTGWPAPPPVPEAGDEQRHADGVTGEPEWGERP